ncbi:MAG: PRC-barrel domain-containing protein [Acetobacteraceae bacterium]|jgi:sporulation protein YlmC with PRC-barrel domain|nr:PRC-barrel domain-containing protein [Acetobacteraceae bacterium]
MKNMIGAVAAAIVAVGLLSSPVLAQTSEGVMGTMNGHKMARSSKLVGSPVYNAKGEEIGTVTDVLIAPSGGSSMAVLSVGKYVGKGDKMVAVPLSNFQMSEGKMLIPAADQLSLERMHEFVWKNFYSEGAG